MKPAATLEQQRLTARGLGGSCREEAMQQLEDCNGWWQVARFHTSGGGF